MTKRRNDWPEIALPEDCSLVVDIDARAEEVTITVTVPVEGTSVRYYAQVTDSSESYKRYDEEEKRTMVRDLVEIARTEARIDYGTGGSHG